MLVVQRRTVCDTLGRWIHNYAEYDKQRKSGFGDSLYLLPNQLEVDFDAKQGANPLEKEKQRGDHG